MTSAPCYKRILIKLSGEVMLGERTHGIDPQAARSIALTLKEIHDLKVELAIVIGGGNIFRGVSASAKGMDRTTADYMGMLATVINGLALQSALEDVGVPTRLQNAFSMDKVAELYIRRRAMRHLEKGRAVIFSGGTGNPYFSTDTTAALRASEIDAEVVIKATKVDGIYTDDPLKNPDAKKYTQISYREMIDKRLKVMDVTAVSLCMENNLPILVCNMRQKDSLKRILMGEPLGTIVKEC